MNKKNSLLIAVITLFLAPIFSYAASGILYFSPASETVSMGQNFWVDIMVDTKGDAVNAIAVYFDYPQDKLESLGVSIEGSPMTIWAEKEAIQGTVKIAGGLPTPGFSGVKKVAAVGFRPKVSSGSVTFKVGAKSAVLRNSDNINILSLANSKQGIYSFTSSQPASQTTTPPVMNLTISDAAVVDRSRNSAKIYWKTNVDSSSMIEYGPDTDYGFSTTSDVFTQEHILTISQLSPGLVYHFRVKSRDFSGQIAETDDLTFTTLGYRVEIIVINPETNNPLVGATVSANDGSGEAVVTDEEGRAVFENLPEGTQKISVQYKENSSYDNKIEVKDKEGTQTFSVSLHRPLWMNPLVLIGFFTLIAFLIFFSVIRFFISRKRRKIDSTSYPLNK